MTEDQQFELRQIHAEQTALRAQWTRLEDRLAAWEAAARTQPAPAPIGEPVRPDPPPASTPPLPESAPSAAPRPQPATNAADDSLEVRIGSTWLVRAGIVLLLTSLVFAGNYLYKNIFPHLGPGSKVALLYAAAGTLTAVGAWLERSRQAREITGLQNYARVVLAGGLAAVYYVTYAAHYLPKLRIIESSLAAGALLLAWTACMVWLADRRNSEILATFAILLAYYTSAINEIASFTLWSNLGLSAGAIYLLRRHLWRIFPFATLLATFGSYAFWRYVHLYPFEFTFYDAHGPRLTTPLWVECSFLSIYWALFTGAVLSSGEELLSSGRRAGFVSVNNGAFFLLMTWLRNGEYPFWRWAAGFGALLLVIGELSARLPRPLGPATRGAYRGMGILLVTIGSIAYFSGWHLSLMLAAETVLLVVGAGRESSVLLLAAAIACAALTTVNTIADIDGSASVWLVDASIGGLLLFAAWWCRQLREQRSGLGAHSGWVGLLEGTPAYFSLLAAAVWFFLLENRIAAISARAPVLAGAALALLALGYLLRIEKLGWYALAYLLLAQVQWLAQSAETDWTIPPWPDIGALLAATVAFGWNWKWLAQQQDSGLRWQLERQPLYILILALGTGCGLRYITIVNPAFHIGAFTLVARWSVYAAAVFALGLLVHERVYRWLGLLILCFTLFRVVLVDLWKLDLLERAISFLSLGVVLLAVGFLYNRFSAKFRDIL